jgi:hypothetical protein
MTLSGSAPNVKLPRRGVAGPLPRHQLLAAPRPVPDPDLHAREQRVRGVLEALPQGSAVGRPDDEVAAVKELAPRRGQWPPPLAVLQGCLGRHHR